MSVEFGNDWPATMYALSWFHTKLEARTFTAVVIYNIARVLPYLIPIGVIMVYFSTYARPCVHSMTCVTCRQTRVSVA